MLFITLFVVVFVSMCLFVCESRELSEWERVTRKYQEVVEWEETWKDVVSVPEPAPLPAVDDMDVNGSLEQFGSEVREIGRVIDSRVSTLEDFIVYLVPGTVGLLAQELGSLPIMTKDTNTHIEPVVGAQSGQSCDDWVWVEPADTLTGITVALFSRRLDEIRERSLTVYEEDGYQWVA